MIKKLRIKFVAVNMSIVFIMLCVILGLVFYFTRSSLEAQSITMLKSIASSPFRLEMPDQAANSVRLPYFTVQLGMNGELMATGGGYYNLSDDNFISSLAKQAFSSPKSFGIISDYNLRYYRIDKAFNHCVVFADISSEVETLNNLIRSCLFIGAIGFFTFLAISIMLSKWAVKPVDLAWQRQRQFISDASHELKTPLTVIMTNTELAQSDAYSEDEKKKFLSSVLTMSHQMRGLLEQMLELARSDISSASDPFEIIDLSRVVYDSILPFEPVFFEKNLAFTSNIEPKIKINGCAQQLSRIVSVLLDNAQKYSNPNASVHIALAVSAKNRCLLTVSNDGEALSKDEAENIFKRFYRADKARSRTGSFGLGLSIAKNITERHRGKIWAQSRSGVNSFFVELPCIN